MIVCVCFHMPEGAKTSEQFVHFTVLGTCVQKLFHVMVDMKIVMMNVSVMHIRI